MISEIQYKPAARNDKRELEFLEIYNSGPFQVGLAGHRLDGVIQFAFPPNAVLNPGAFLVVARAPEDIRAIYRITNVIGWPKAITQTNGSGKTASVTTVTQTLPASGEIALRNPGAAKLLSVAYSDQPIGVYDIDITVCDIRPRATPLAADLPLEVQPGLQTLETHLIDPGRFQLVWVGPTCHPALLQHRDSLSEGKWRTVLEKLRSNGGVNQLRLPVEPGMGYYRLVYQ